MEINEMANKNIHQLKLYLAQLPSSLPVPSNPHPDFRQFAPKAGVLPGDKAVQEALEAAMGPFNSSNFVIRERGPGIQALGDVLERYLAQYPLSLPLQQWLYMALLAAENTFRRYNIKLPSLDAQPQVAPTMIMSVPPRAGQARYSATSFRSYYAPAPTTPGLFANGLSPTGFSSALRASERTASTLSAQSATASRETSRTSNPTLTSKDKGTKMIPTARKPSEATVPRRAKSTPKTKHEAYSAPVIVLDERLMQHVEALMMTRPCLRTHSYLVPKLPWLSGWIPDNTLLETALQRHIAFSVCTGASDVDNAASGSSDAAEQVHNHDLLLRFSRRLDVWEHGGIYRNTEKACIAFRWMGIESESSVRLGADRFLEIGLTKIEDCQWLVSLRALDALAWACWPHVQPLSAANAAAVARNNGHALSYLLSAPVNNPVGWATCSADWVSRISKVADSGAIKSSVHHIMSADAIAQLKAFSWDDKRPPKLPERQNLDNALPSLLKAATGTLSVDLVHRELAATHSNFKAAAAALAFILHEYGSDNETEDNRLVDLTELKDRIIAAQEKHQVTNLTAKNLMYPLAVALFVSPIFLFNKVQLVKNVLPFEELFETWKLLGNENRPEALSRIERDIWKLLLRVLDGADLMACLLSYLEYWKVIAPDFESKFEEARTWFKPGHLPANMRGTARQGNKGTTSQANVATSSDSGEQANSCIDPQLLTDHAVTHNAAGPSNEAARNGVHGVKRPYAEAQAQAESSKKPRLSVSTSPTPGDRSVETGSNISPLAGRTTPTPSQDDDGLYFTEDPPFLPLNESPAPSTAQTADSVPTAAEDISNRPSSETLLASALAEVNRLRSERDALQAEHEPLKTEHKALKTEAAKLRSDRDTLSERLSGLSGRLATTQNLVERAEGRERALGAELASVRLRKEKALALEATLAESNARADSAEDHVRQLKAEREDLLVKLRASESAVATARSEAQRISAERHAHVEDVTGKLEGVSANIAILTKAVEAWRIQSQQIAAERDLLLQGMRELLPAEAGPTSADSSDVLRSVAAEMERLREQVLDADQRASNADQRAATAEQERASMEDAHDRRAAHITVLQRRIAELESNSWKF